MSYARCLRLSVESAEKMDFSFFVGIDWTILWGDKIARVDGVDFVSFNVLYGQDVNFFWRFSHLEIWVWYFDSRSLFTREKKLFRETLQNSRNEKRCLLNFPLRDTDVLSKDWRQRRCARNGFSIALRELRICGALCVPHAVTAKSVAPRAHEKEMSWWRARASFEKKKERKIGLCGLRGNKVRRMTDVSCGFHGIFGISEIQVLRRIFPTEPVIYNL